MLQNRSLLTAAAKGNMPLVFALLGFIAAQLVQLIPARHISMSESDLAQVVVVAVITGAITGAVSVIGTVASLRVHIQYLREMLQKHDLRLRHVEQTMVAPAKD